MNCPSCGASTEQDQQFCRVCGTALTGNPPRGVRPQMVMLILFIMIFVGIMAGITGGMTEIKWLKFTGVFIAIAGMFSVPAASLIMSMRKSGRRPNSKKRVEPAERERADTTNKLLPIGENDFIPSVVENTTDLLPRARSERSSGRDGSRL